jgi:hypothetical protein
VIGQIIHQDIKGAARFIRPDRHPGDVCSALSFSCGREHYKESDRMHKGKKTKRQIFLLHF